MTGNHIDYLSYFHVYMKSFAPSLRKRPAFPYPKLNHFHQAGRNAVPPRGRRDFIPTASLPEKTPCVSLSQTQSFPPSRKKRGAAARQEGFHPDSVSS